jgi:DNA-binding MarR family transcriptional regulator
MSRPICKDKTVEEGQAPGDLIGRELSAAVVAFHAAVAYRLGLSATEWKCLGILAQLEPATAGQLAEATGLTTGAITGIVDRLERTGYARREPNPDDRRSVIIRPLRQREVFEQVEPIFQSLREAMAKVYGGYSQEELVAIRSFLALMVEALKSETAKLRQEEGSAKPRRRRK